MGTLGPCASAIVVPSASLGALVRSWSRRTTAVRGAVRFDFGLRVDVGGRRARDADRVAAGRAGRGLLFAALAASRSPS